jgi:hypothetical protein
MNDLDLITDLRPEMPLAGPDQLAHARAQVMAAVAAEPRAPRAAVAGPRQRRVAGTAPSRWPRRLAMSAVGASAVAAGVAVALVAGSASAPPGGRPSGRPSGASFSHPGSSGRHVQPATLAAAQWLSSAATATRQQAFVVPRPDQYVFTETVGPPNGTGKSRMWHSVDGSRTGLEEPAGLLPGPLPPCTVAQAQAAQVKGGCALKAGYLPQMPASPQAMLDYLTGVGVAFTVAPPLTAIVLGKDLSGVFPDVYLSPAQRAGMFQLMAQTPGFTLVRHAVDALGRSGVGIAWQDTGLTMMIIFNRQTYGYMGENILLRADARWQPFEALVTMKIVNKLPPHEPFNPQNPNSSDH